MRYRFFSGVVRLRTILFGLAIVFYITTFGLYAAAPIEEKIKEAEDLLNLKPSQFLDILASIEASLLDADPKIRLKAYTSGIWAGQNKASVEVVRKYTDLLVSVAGEDAVLTEVPRIASVLATQFWLMGEYTMAKQFAYCSLHHTDKRSHYASLTNTIGMSLHREEKLELAQAVFDIAMLFDRRHNLTRYEAGIHNNSGVLALETADFASVKEHFEQALDIRHKDSHLSGQVTAGTNLLLSLFLQKDWDTFERLVGRMNRLHDLHGSELLRHYYDWLTLAFDLRDQTTLSDTQQRKLEQYYTSIDDHFIQVFLAQAATNMQWNMPEPIPEKPKPGASIDIRPYFSFCDWQQLAQVQDSDIVSFLEQKQRFMLRP